MRANLRALPNDSVYIPITRVGASSSKNWSRSLPEMSALSPSDTKVDTPIPSVCTRSRIDDPSEPDCSENPTPPSGSVPGTSVACIATSGLATSTPRLPGPIMRIPYRRQWATSSGTSSPAGAVVITIAPRTRWVAQARSTGSSSSWGTATIARCTSPGTASIDG